MTSEDSAAAMPAVSGCDEVLVQPARKVAAMTASSDGMVFKMVWWVVLFKDHEASSGRFGAWSETAGRKRERRMVPGNGLGCVFTQNVEAQNQAHQECQVEDRNAEHRKPISLRLRFALNSQRAYRH